jgi:hypothetical protein
MCLQLSQSEYRCLQHQCGRSLEERPHQQVYRIFGLEDELSSDIEQTLAAGSAKVGAGVAATHR